MRTVAVVGGITFSSAGEEHQGRVDREEEPAAAAAATAPS